MSKHFQYNTFSFENGEYMRHAHSADFKGEMALDYRSTTERNNTRYNIDTVTLNTGLDVYRAKPKLIDRR